MTEDLFRVGSIATTHGVRGEVKVYPTTQEPERFKKIKEVIMVQGNEEKTLHIESVKFFKQMVILKFKEFDSLNEVENLRGCELFVTRKNAVPLGKDEYYVADLVGLKVESEEGKQIGVLDDVMQTGANDVYIVRKEDGGEVLIPAIKECIKKVDISDGKMIIHVMPGLLD